MTNTNIVPISVPRNYELLRFWEDGSLLLAASDLTGRLWTGVICYLQEAEGEKSSDVTQWTVTRDVDSGIADGLVLCKNSTKFTILGYDYGGIEMLQLLHDESGATAPVFTPSAYCCEHDDVVSSMRLTCDKLKMVSGSYDKSIKIWDLESFATCTTYLGAHWNLILNVDCHPESADIIASCSRDGRVLMWDMRLSRPASVISRGPFHAVPTAIRWQPNHDTRILIGDETGGVALADIRNVNGKVQYIATNERQIFNMEFAPWSHEKLAVCADDVTVSVLNVIDDALEIGYQASDLHTDFVHGLAWHPTSGILHTCSWDQTIKVHTITTPINGST